MHITPLPDLVILLAAAVAIVTCFKALKLSPVLGYLVAGAIIGPKGFGVIHDMDATSAIAELGIVFLLFMIGLELSWDRLKAMRGQVFGIGTAQVLVTGSLFAALAHALGESVEVAILIGGGLALSSTALVLQVLQQRGELASQTGRLSLAILILQDLAVLPLLVLVPAIASEEGSLLSALGDSAIRAVLVMGGIILVGRIIVRPLFRLIAQYDIHELFVAATLLVVLGISWATQMVGLSMALGAFLAGLLLAETEFRQQVELDVRPYKLLLMGLFFMTVGMKIDIDFILRHSYAILLGAAILIAIKATVLYLIFRVTHYSQRTAAHTALLLAQGGEFGFILFGLAGQLGVIDGILAQKLLLVIAITMAATPLLEIIGAQVERQWWRRMRQTPEQLEHETQDLTGHIVVAGYGRMGQLIAHALAEEQIPFVALDTNPREVGNGRKRNHPVYFGDAARPDVLEAMGVSRAIALVITLHIPDEADKLMKAMRASYPDLPIFVRAKDLAHQRALEIMGATFAVPELEVSSMRLVSHLLSNLGRPEEEIARVMEAMRS